MIKIQNVETWGFKHAIHGMRNPLNSWDKSDSYIELCDVFVGDADLALMHKLYKAGAEHRKYLRQIFVSMDIVAPLYWWKEFDTYKVGTVANSCSTMHKIADKEFTLDDFSCEHLYQETYDLFRLTIDHLNKVRDIYLNRGVLRVGEAPAWFGPKDKEIWWQMIQLLPSSYNQKRTVMLNYEVLANMYESRKNHKLDEWRDFCKWTETLPYSELITGEIKHE